MEHGAARPPKVLPRPRYEGSKGAGIVDGDDHLTCGFTEMDDGATSLLMAGTRGEGEASAALACIPQVRGSQRERKPIRVHFELHLVEWVQISVGRKPRVSKGHGGHRGSLTTVGPFGASELAHCDRLGPRPRRRTNYHLEVARR